MDKHTAIQILKALACCSFSELRCGDDCPRWDAATGKCKNWTIDEVVEAVRTLNEIERSGEL